MTLSEPVKLRRHRFLSAGEGRHLVQLEGKFRKETERTGGYIRSTQQCVHQTFSGMTRRCTSVKKIIIVDSDSEHGAVSNTQSI